MSVGFYYELKSCVKGELIQYLFDGFKKMYLGLLSEAEFDKYKQDVRSVDRNLCSSGAIGEVDKDGTQYAVFDIGGTGMKAISTSVRRFSPSFARKELSVLTPPQGVSFVQNATNTPSDGSMIQYWKDNQHKDSKINLDNKTFKCPSCGKTVKTSELHGAHVVKIGDKSQILYITPTCDSCNTSKTDRIFKVASIDLVEAPTLKKY